jgi:hypothetical protein
MRTSNGKHAPALSKSTGLGCIYLNRSCTVPLQRNDLIAIASLKDCSKNQTECALFPGEGGSDVDWDSKFDTDRGVDGDIDWDSKFDTDRGMVYKRDGTCGKDIFS